MPTVKLKVQITSDHRVSGIVPDEVPAGVAQAVVLYTIPPSGEESGAMHLSNFIEKVQKKGYPRRSMDEILAYINSERDSWED